MGIEGLSAGNDCSLMSPCDESFQRLIYSFGIGSVLANSCLNPDTQFPNTSSLNARKNDVCDNFKGIVMFSTIQTRDYSPDDIGLIQYFRWSILLCKMSR